MLKTWIKENKAIAGAIAALISAVIYQITGVNVDIEVDEEQPAQVETTATTQPAETTQTTE